MATSGIERIFISASNMEESLAFYRDFIGMKVIGEEALAPEEIQGLWKLPAGTTARAVFLKKDLQSTMLELIQFTPNSGKTIRAGDNIVDFGLFDLCFQVKRVRQIHKELVAKGFKFTSLPVQYDPPWVPYEVTGVILIGPDDVHIAHVERMTEEESTDRYIRFIDSCQIVEDIDPGIKFYRDILGLELRNVISVPEGMLDPVLMLSSGNKVKLVGITDHSSIRVIKKENPPSVQFFEISKKGKSLAPIAKPPNLGIFMISFEVDNLSSMIETLQKEGVPILSGPVALTTGLHGKMKAITVEAPNGVIVELFER